MFLDAASALKKSSIRAMHAIHGQRELVVDKVVVNAMFIVPIIPHPQLWVSDKTKTISDLALHAVRIIFLCIHRDSIHCSLCPKYIFLVAGFLIRLRVWEEDTMAKIIWVG